MILVSVHLSLFILPILLFVIRFSLLPVRALYVALVSGERKRKGKFKKRSQYVRSGGIERGTVSRITFHVLVTRVNPWMHNAEC